MLTNRKRLKSVPCVAVHERGMAGLMRGSCVVLRRRERAFAGYARHPELR